MWGLLDSADFAAVRFIIVDKIHYFRIFLLRTVFSKFYTYCTRYAELSQKIRTPVKFGFVFPKTEQGKYSL